MTSSVLFSLIQNNLLEVEIKKGYFTKEVKMIQFIVDNVPNTKDAALVEKYFAGSLTDNSFNKFLIRSRIPELIEEAKRLEAENNKEK